MSQYRLLERYCDCAMNRKPIGLKQLCPCVAQICAELLDDVAVICAGEAGRQCRGKRELLVMEVQGFRSYRHY